MPVALFITAAFLLVAFAGLMAAVDAAITVQSRADIADLALHSRAKKSLTAIADDPGPHLNAVNFVRITAETTAAVLVTLVFSFTIDELWIALVVSALVMTIVSFILVGASPRGFGRTHAGAILTVAAPVVRFVRVVLGPLPNALVAFGNRVTPGVSRNRSFSSEQQLLSMVDEAAEQDVLEEDDRELIHSIFEFNSTVVREVMVPRTDMITIEDDLTVDQAMSVLLRTGVSRAPVRADEVDDVIGILYLRDLARALHEGGATSGERIASELARPPLFVPESKKADAMLQQMQAESNHLAMVIDEYGGVAGLVTLEDLIEELVGDISDEYDANTDEVTDLGDGRYRVDARLAADEVGELFDIELDDDDVDSIGGLLTKTLDRLPVQGSQATVGGLVITADRTEGRRGRLKTVVVERTDALADVQASFDQSKE
jgi:CBS domain containing-hemolysin-like protein